MFETPAHVGARVGQLITFAHEAHHPRRIALQVVYADLAGKSASIRIKAGFDTGNAQCEPCGDAIRRRELSNDVENIGGIGGFIRLDARLGYRKACEHERPAYLTWSAA